MLASVRVKRSETKGCTVAPRLLASATLFLVERRESRPLGGEVGRLLYRLWRLVR
jgi:hypothetical protein